MPIISLPILHRSDCFVSDVKLYDAKEFISHNIFNILYISATNWIQKKCEKRRWQKVCYYANCKSEIRSILMAGLNWRLIVLLVCNSPDCQMWRNFLELIFLRWKLNDESFRSSNGTNFILRWWESNLFICRHDLNQ